MTTAVQMHGLDSRAIGRMARKFAMSGKAISEPALSAEFMVSEPTINKIVNDSRFVALVNSKVYAILHRDGVRAAVSLLVNTARDDTANLGHRLRAAELILSRTMPAAQAAAPDATDRDLAEMSADELRHLVDDMQGELAQRATPFTL